ncbi:unnamed protein product [Staurois parvus]|uniref:Uncharacterized protein n=1 Tax=Staurois parvus TaxID=386267 RepID=A0ABN9C966_9NEOB|nr:unnamed protein product [Staurois parvus]
MTKKGYNFKKLAMPLMKYVRLSNLQKRGRPDIWGISVLSLTFGGYLYCPDIWGISVPS